MSNFLLEKVKPVVVCPRNSGVSAVFVAVCGTNEYVRTNSFRFTVPSKLFSRVGGCGYFVRNESLKQNKISC